MTFTKKHIVVIGSGVVGLQTAVSLLQTGKYSVSIIAEYFPGDESINYTSPWAGAQWRTHAPESQKDTIGAWDILSLKTWMEMVRESPTGAAEKGIESVPSYFYWANEHRSALHPPWFSSHVQPFHHLSPADLPSGCESGYTYPSIVIDPSLYLLHLERLAASLGATKHRAALPTPLPSTIQHLVNTIASSPVDAIVNASGLGARTLVPDPAVHAIRGQTLLVRFSRPVRRLQTREDATPGAETVTYIIPRREDPPSQEDSASPEQRMRDMCGWLEAGAHLGIVGGTKDAGEERAQPDKAITGKILERARQMWPEGFEEGAYEVLETRVGLRPGRKGGPRVEAEEVMVGEGEGKTAWKVVHAYGNAGAGFQNALGMAKDVVQLVDGLFEK